MCYRTAHPTSAVTIEVTTLAAVEDCCSGAGGPIVSPANATELPTKSTQTNAKALSDFDIGTSEIVFS